MILDRSCEVDKDQHGILVRSGISIFVQNYIYLGGDFVYSLERKLDEIEGTYPLSH